MGLGNMMRRRDVIGLLAAAALPWPRPARASQALLDESVGFAGQVLFLSLKVPALVLGVTRDGQTSIQGFGRRADNVDEAPGRDTLFGLVRSPSPSPARFWRAWLRTAWSASPTL